MAVSGCYTGTTSRKKSTCKQEGDCASDSEVEKLSATSRPIPTDLTLDELRMAIARLGEADEELYAYVVRSVTLRDDEYVQQGSGPNFDGGFITLCSCKHRMRTARTPDGWLRGAWVAGFTGHTNEFSKQQSLVYLMRVGEAYDSQAELVQALRQSHRENVVKAKDSTRHRRGDLILPKSSEIAEKQRHAPETYHPPMVKNVHRGSPDDDTWIRDVDYVGGAGRQSAMLVGAKEYSFMWTRPVIRRAVGGPTRPYRKLTLNGLLNQLITV